MNNIRELRRRIRSATNIEHITSAMQKVSAARLNKARQRLGAVRPYADTLNGMAHDLACEYHLQDHPLLRANAGDKVLAIAVSSDKGLCGAFNGAIAAQLEALVKAYPAGTVEVLACGKKIRDYCVRRGIPVFAEHVSIPVFFKFSFARSLADEVMRAYESGRFAKVNLLYTRFVSPRRQEPKLDVLLPFVFAACKERDVAGNFIYEPGAQALLRGLVPSAVRTAVWEALLESSASEHASRMIMMEQASVNADKMINELVQTANRLRQSTITKELTEIVGTSEALK